jgi:hypothetical protein
MLFNWIIIVIVMPYMGLSFIIYFGANKHGNGDDPFVIPSIE